MFQSSLLMVGLLAAQTPRIRSSLVVIRRLLLPKLLIYDWRKMVWLIFVHSFSNFGVPTRLLTFSVCPFVCPCFSMPDHFSPLRDSFFCSIHCTLFAYTWGGACHLFFRVSFLPALRCPLHFAHLSHRMMISDLFCWCLQEVPTFLPPRRLRRKTLGWKCTRKQKMKISKALRLCRVCCVDYTVSCPFPTVCLRDASWRLRRSSVSTKIWLCKFFTFGYYLTAGYF